MKNRQNRERRKRGGYRKSRGVIDGKRIDEKNVICVQSLSCHDFFLLAEGGVRSLVKATSKADRWKETGKSFTRS